MKTSYLAYMETSRFMTTTPALQRFNVIQCTDEPEGDTNWLQYILDFHGQLRPRQPQTTDRLEASHQRFFLKRSLLTFPTNTSLYHNCQHGMHNVEEHLFSHHKHPSIHHLARPRTEQYQPFQIGPQKGIIPLLSATCKAEGLPFTSSLIVPRDALFPSAW